MPMLSNQTKIWMQLDDMDTKELKTENEVEHHFWWLSSMEKVIRIRLEREFWMTWIQTWKKTHPHSFF